MASMKKVNTDYWKAKQMELDRGEEWKRKREDTRDNRERGWQVAPVDEGGMKRRIQICNKK
jgi:hypothetical protein